MTKGNKEPKEGRYSKVTRRMWDSEDFCALSPARPNAQTLWLRLLTGPELTNIPGLFVAREGGLADALGWSVSSLRAKLKEITSRGMAHFDRSKGLFWVPKAINHNAPDNPNVVKHWRLAWKEMPDCEVKRVAEGDLRAWCEARGAAWANAFDAATGRVDERVLGNGTGKGSDNPSGNPPPKQEQDQDQEQEKPPNPLSELSDRARQYLDLADAGHGKGRTQADLTFGNPAEWPEVTEVCFGGMVAAYGRQDAPRGSGDRRVRVVLERFVEGYSPGDLCRALLGSRKAEYIAEKREWQVVTTLLRDAAQVDKFLGLLDEAPRQSDPEHANLEALLS